ncbi:hypothetical protein [Haloquadratum walsbyi]|jgi:hypothetical protein|uniref:Uncharacterized protein n=1 Tax=Haloquadratum walsbyi J07HQW2 TaxID=1238425 RepID=U1PQ84_9EURY|nr:hypothetical protein [Haloquadratum walsbyi]ERG95907.1 MAG: hypothetical protein J07HQW2_02367 [Haloquadratum walsbyi J07HQW2]
MSREQLQSASENLRTASEAADGTIQRTLYEQSNDIAELAARNQEINQGQINERLGNLQTLIETIEDTDNISADVTDHVDQAKSDLATLRGDSDMSDH